MVQIHYERLDTICGYGGMADTTDFNVILLSKGATRNGRECLIGNNESRS
jgi:hypothetical protein